MSVHIYVYMCACVCVNNIRWESFVVSVLQYYDASYKKRSASGEIELSSLESEEKDRFLEEIKKIL
jgi:hypothetical protein